MAYDDAVFYKFTGHNTSQNITDGRTRNMTKRTSSIYKQQIEKPRLTPWGRFYIFLFMGLPILMALILIDLLLYALFKYGFNSCYGISCLFQP
ncbi:MAG: hypothetical protein CMF31_08680 [Kordiimonas sp.]|nr:hypothetical protein [Kordiimonas sp.]